MPVATLNTNTQRSHRLASLLRAVGVVTFLLSVASPYDDAFQQSLGWQVGDCFACRENGDVSASRA